MSTKLLFFFLLFLLLLSIHVSISFSIGEDEAVSAITKAEETNASAYRALIDAEKAGATTSGLINRLNDAASYLAKAKVFYEINDFNNASLFANNSTEIANAVKIEAFTIKYQAIYESNQCLMFSIAESALGVCIVFFTSFFGWRVFKQYYYNRVLKLKPELSADEA